MKKDNSKKISKGNKLIAEFDTRVNTNWNTIGRYPIDDLKYYSSWDWLMPVVSKIQGECGCRFYLTANEEHAEARFTDMAIPGNEIVKVKSYTYTHLIEVVWELVVKYVKWYNKEIKKLKNK